ncbi:T9SS type A sorting domain-containing protein [Mangrovimonas sp. ST2L15]|uniref:T9SS type A sorting domain-containing protein n=1 Tax=Mangrovimonas sp. ST2L15 TaxID=1645916 RepID=UPI000AE0D773|nr:T9SS type A sorting domain-containing protein [Mangrovimonas sp. ST2L15]
MDFDDGIDLSGANLRSLIDIDFMSQDYDIIYINWNNGVGDIRENSDLLEMVLDWVNTNKQGNEHNVLLGQSMGGVIGRYTLARMEQEDANFNPNDPSTSPHDVELFIAHDSPMQGSNTPISIQHFSRHMLNFYMGTPVAYAIGENALPVIYGIAELGSSLINDLFGWNTTVDPYVSPEAYLTIQDSPAAVQMNYWWVDYEENATTDLHDSWQQEFEAMGYPQGPRNIAISNGSECADDHGFSPGDLLLQVDDLDNPDIFGDIVNMIAVAGSNDIGLSFVGSLPGASKWYYDFDLRSTPNGGGQQVYYGSINYEKKLLWLLTITQNVTQRNINSPSGILPHGYYPGGSYDVDNALGNLPDQFPPVIVHNQKYGFIPVVSALDIKRNSNQVNQSDYLKSYSGGTTPEPALTSNFENFIVGFAPGENNEHISFQTRNGNWLATELGDNNATTTDYSYICDDTQISGNEYLCFSSVYSVPNIASTYNWTVTSGGNLVTLSGSNSHAVTVTPNNNLSGNITLEVTYGDGGTVCGDVTKILNIRVGAPTVIAKLSNGEYISHGYTNQVCKNQQMYTDMSINGQTSVTWTLLSSSHTTSWSQQGNNITFYLWAVNHTATFRFTTSNNCGTITRDYTFVSKDCSGGGGDPDPCDPPLLTYSVYPNPTSSSLEIGTSNPTPNIPAPCRTASTKPSEKNGKFSGTPSRATLYDFNGNEVKTQIPAQGKMDIEDLKEGHYILVIQDGDESESHHIIIK